MKSRTSVEGWLRGTKNCAVFTGQAVFEGPNGMRVGDDVLEADSIFLNVGALGSVDTGMLRIIERVHSLDHDPASAIDDSALQFGRLAQRGADLEIDPVGHAGHQVATLGEKLGGDAR